MKTKKYTVKDAEETVAYIESISNDPEHAHGAEDVLNETFIKGVAQGLYNLEEAIAVAKVITQVSDLSFERWYA